jgi:hypothetical protein
VKRARDGAVSVYWVIARIRDIGYRFDRAGRPKRIRRVLHSPRPDIHIDTFLDTQQNTTLIRRRGSNNHRIDDTSHELNRAYIDRLRREVLL